MKIIRRFLLWFIVCVLLAPIAAAQTSTSTPDQTTREKSVAKIDEKGSIKAPQQIPPKPVDTPKTAYPAKRSKQADLIADDPDDALPRYLRDRGTGVATSQFGVFVHRGETIFYPFFEYYRDHNFEYKPEEFGAVGGTDFRGRSRASEGLFFVAYGLTENVEVEFEAATIKATFEKSPLDRSALPAKIQESGLGDVEGQIRWRFLKENEHRPEFFTYAELVIPHNKRKVLIGTPGVEINVGAGMTKGYSWGTMTFRGAVEYANNSTSKFDIGEYAVEYLKRLSPRWQLYLGVEGTSDEISLIPQLQWRLTKHMSIKFNTGIGLTSRATDFAPEIGIVYRFGGKY